MSRATIRAQMQQEAVAWEASHRGWDADLPDPESLFQPIEITDEAEDGRKVRDTRRAVPEPPVDKRGLPVLGDKKPRKRNKKIVNVQLLRHDSSEEESAEAEAWRIGGNAKLRRELAYCLTIYTGKYRQVLALMAELKTCPQIAKIVGKTDRRIQQVVHGNASKGRKAQPGLRQICREIVANGVPVEFQSTPPVHVPVVVQPVRTLKKSLQKQAVLGQLGWDFDALMGVAA